MDAKEYQKEISKWSKWKEDYKRYHKVRRELIEAGEEDDELDELEKHHKPSLFGPFTFISDKADLLNPSFILPGMDSSFLDLPGTDHRIPEYFGKRIFSELENLEGTMIGYGYDAGDDYIRLRDDTGEIHDILVNSPYHVVE